MLSRLSPSLMKDEITRMREELNDLDENTLVRYLSYLPTIVRLTLLQTRTKTATGKIDERKLSGELSKYSSTNFAYQWRSRNRGKSTNVGYLGSLWNVHPLILHASDG